MKKRLRNVLISAFLIRFVALIIIVATGDYISTGLLGSTVMYDDVRYMETGEIFLQNAHSVFDVKAHKNTMDTVEPGYIHEVFTSLWDWAVCIMYYILGNGFLVRVVNLLFAVVTVFCIYEISFTLYGEKVARVASLLYAFLPYPVIFSCFLYKDQFYTMITLLLFWKAFQCVGKITLKDTIILLILLVASMFTRTGLVVLIGGALLVILYKNKVYRINMKNILVIIPLIIGLISYFVWVSWDDIQLKFVSYVYEYSASAEGDIVDYFVIKDTSQIWRYPFSLCFLLFQPLNLSLTIHSWMSVAGILNIVFIPVAVGNLLYLFAIKVKGDYFFWISQLFFFVTILTSLGIVRHQYYLQPFIIILFSVYYYKARSKFLLISGSTLAWLTVFYLWIMNI